MLERFILIAQPSSNWITDRLLEIQASIILTIPTPTQSRDGSSRGELPAAKYYASSSPYYVLHSLKRANAPEAEVCTLGVFFLWLEVLVSDAGRYLSYTSQLPLSPKRDGHCETCH